MEGDDVRLAQLDPRHLADGRSVRRGLGGAAPHSAGQRLLGTRLAGPAEHQRQERGHPRGLVFRLLRRIASAVGVVRLVPHVPRQDAVVLGERSHHPLHVGLQARLLAGVGQGRRAGTLHPARVVHPWNRWMLRPETR